MKLKGAAHAAADRRRVVDSSVISNTEVADKMYCLFFFSNFFCFSRGSEGPLWNRTGRRSVGISGVNANDDADASWFLTSSPCAWDILGRLLSPLNAAYSFNYLPDCGCLKRSESRTVNLKRRDWCVSVAACFKLIRPMKETVKWVRRSLEAVWPPSTELGAIFNILQTWRVAYSRLQRLRSSSHLSYLLHTHAFRIILN